MIFWVWPLTLYAFAVAPMWQLAPICGLLAWIGISMGHGHFATPKWSSYIGMMWITLFRMALFFAPTAAVDQRFLLPMAFGVLTAPACWLGYTLSRRHRFGPVKIDAGDSSCEEFCIGLLPWGSGLVVGAML